MGSTPPEGKVDLVFEIKHDAVKTEIVKESTIAKESESVNGDVISKTVEIDTMIVKTTTSSPPPKLEVMKSEKSESSSKSVSETEK